MGFFATVDHTADIGVEITGDSLEDLFITAGTALTDQLVSIESVISEDERKIEIEGRDKTDLLVKWLKGVLSLYQIEYFLSNEFKILKLENNKISAMIKGEMFNDSRHEIKNDIKAVTYHQAEVVKTDTGYRVTVIMDV